MPTIFTRIIQGELPGRFVWRDEKCVAFLTIQPIRHGHTLVVPIEEVEHWIDLDPSLNAHLFTVAQTIARAQMLEWNPTRVGLMVAGLEVPHVHLHVLPIDSTEDLKFESARSAPAAELEEAAERLRRSLRAMGVHEVAER